MALADRSMAIFFSNQLENPHYPVKGTASNSQIESMLVKAKLQGFGPWGELFERRQISSRELEVMMIYETASITEKKALLKVCSNKLYQLIHNNLATEWTNN